MQQPEQYIGLMSGTSLDGVDAVLVDLSGNTPRLLKQHFSPFDDAFRQQLLSLHQPKHNELHEAQIISNQLAQLYAKSVTALAPDIDLVKAVGCHGQTIRHCPEHGYTLQIGNAALLAELAGITVVNDFRGRDIAAGGQGAPLLPAFHDKLLRHAEIHRVIVNIGGISNVTNLPPHAATTGFDCGPGNLLLDVWCQQHQSTPFDDSGAWAASGTVLPELLARMLLEPFFALSPPKSTGRDLFNMDWLTNLLTGNETAADVQATLLELTAQSITQDVLQHCIGATEIYLCGGGAHNQTLCDRLDKLLPANKIQTTNALDVDGDYLEAIAFAWLAQQTLSGNAANLPQVTGAKHPCILGAIHPA